MKIENEKHTLTASFKSKKLSSEGAIRGWSFEHRGEDGQLNVHPSDSSTVLVKDMYPINSEPLHILWRIKVLLCAV